MTMKMMKVLGVGGGGEESLNFLTPCPHMFSVFKPIKTAGFSRAQTLQLYH